MELDFQLERFVPQLQLRRQEGVRHIYDPIRKQWLVLQPEEFVRQLLLQFLIHDCGYKRNRLAVERGLTVNRMSRRCDILVYQDDMRPWLLVECKAPEIRLDDATFWQIATYNLALQVDYLLVSNGRQSFCCAMHYESQSWKFLPAMPKFGQIV